LVMEKFPIIKNRIFEIQSDIQHWVKYKYGISNKKQSQWLTDYMAQGSTYIASTMIAISSLIFDILLIPIYVFLISYYQKLLCGGMVDLMKKYKSIETVEVMKESESIMRSFLYGLIIEASIIAALNSLGLYFIGVEQAIMLGIMAAILNIIPYIGGIVGTALPMFVSLTAVNKPSMPIYVLIVMIAVQLIDNNFVQPYVVGSKVKINGLFVMLGVLLGGFIWGVAGMFLAIPALAIFKLFLDRIEGLKPIGKMLGDGKEQKDAEIVTIENY
jgi:AI-2 transport protein TqsA